ncbi:MAG: hypothetical protein E7646_06185 [Ruminococcaceae bacterium]|nr:hypothetical protein [Oscillospiraceae bacterium]
MDYVIFGSDRRFFYLAELLKKENKACYICNSLAEISAFSDRAYVFVTALNTNREDQAILLRRIHKNSVIFSGKLFDENLQLAYEKGIKYHNILDNELFCLENAIPTAEGCIERIISITPYNLSGTEVGVVGFGRVGSAVSRALRRMGANVSVIVREGKSMSCALASSFSVMDINGSLCADIRILINTAEKRDIVNKHLTDRFPRLDTVIDLASGNNVDKAALQKRGICFEDAKGLPGRFSPESSAGYILRVIRGEGL